MRILQLGASEVIIEHERTKKFQARSDAAVFARRTRKSTQGAGKRRVGPNEEERARKLTRATTREVVGRN